MNKVVLALTIFIALLIVGLGTPAFAPPTPNPQIPEFPFAFSLVIIFVLVAAVYIGIRQKMIPGFKKF